MIKNIITIFTTLIVLSFCIKSHASDSVSNCKQVSKDKKDYAFCLDKAAKKLERELKTWVNNHIFHLEETSKKTGRKSALKLFKRAQENFIVYRESNCRWYYILETPNPRASDHYKQCMINITKTRIDELSMVKNEG